MRRLEQLRVDKGMSRAELSAATGVQVKTIWNLERADFTSEPRVQTLKALADHFKVPASELMPERKPKPNGVAA